MCVCVLAGMTLCVCMRLCVSMYAMHCIAPCILLQLKNMVNALYSSRIGGSKEFQLEGIFFGWQSIIDLYQRECRRRNSGAARMVPKLREVHVLRDSWTKLNVHPAKIMQVMYFVVLCQYMYMACII